MGLTFPRGALRRVNSRGGLPERRVKIHPSCHFRETIVRGSYTIDSITSPVLRSNAF
jgi:hypothetical protein